MGTFTMILWLKYTPAATMLYLPKVYHSYQACLIDAAKVEKHYNDIYDPTKTLTTKSIVDAFCL